MGACTIKGQLKIITELAYTDLDRLLKSNKDLSMYQRMKMAKDAAVGINWLHGITNIIHRDLKPGNHCVTRMTHAANLLIDENLGVKITGILITLQ